MFLTGLAPNVTEPLPVFKYVLYCTAIVVVSGVSVGAHSG